MSVQDQLSRLRVRYFLLKGMTLPTAPACYIGTSNIELPVPNKAAFPEAYRNSSRLTYYGSLFDSVEVNSSFYKIPLAKTVARWTEEVPGAFRFTFKLYRELTHGNGQLPDPELVRRFMETVNAAESKAGALLIQFPAGKTHDMVYLERLLMLIQQQNRHWDLCIEFRHPSWYRESTYRLLENQRASLVIHDKSPGNPVPEVPAGQVLYFRQHGPRGDYKGAYEFGQLEQLAGRVGNAFRSGKTVYVYFNNTIGNAVFDALVLQELATGKAPFDP